MESMPPPLPDPSRALHRKRQRRVVWLSSDRYARVCSQVTANRNRDMLVHELVKACLVRSLQLKMMAPSLATRRHLCEFHREDYVAFLQFPDQSDTARLKEYGLLEDCEIFEHLWEYCRAVAGASIQGAQLLCHGSADTVINVGGGRHHAKHAEAAGYCYVNDAVLAIHHLLRHFERIMYIDIDIHHSDGVQQAFYYSKRVLHVSYHKLSAGFYPGTGSMKEIGAGPGRYHSVNFPLLDGVSDDRFITVLHGTLPPLLDSFQPSALVLVCGVDTLSRDPAGSFNLTERGVCEAVRMLQERKLPLLILGGGGYNPSDTARCWTHVAATAMGEFAVQKLPHVVPEHAYSTKYGPDFCMTIPTSFRQDLNTAESIQALIEHALRMAKHIAAAGFGRQPRRADTAKPPPLNLAEPLEADDVPTEKDDAADHAIEVEPDHDLPTDPLQNHVEVQPRLEAAEVAGPDAFPSSSATKRAILATETASTHSHSQTITSTTTTSTSNWRGKRRKKQLGGVPELR